MPESDPRGGAKPPNQQVPEGRDKLCKSSCSLFKRTNMRGMVATRNAAPPASLCIISGQVGMQEDWPHAEGFSSAKFIAPRGVQISAEVRLHGFSTHGYTPGNSQPPALMLRLQAEDFSIVDLAPYIC